MNIKEEEKNVRRLMTRLSFICGDLEEIEKLEIYDKEILEIIDRVKEDVYLLKKMLIEKDRFSQN